MKTLMVLLSMLLAPSASALELDVHVLGAAGYRMGRYEFMKIQPGAFYLSGKLTTMGHAMYPWAYANFFSPSINYQTDGRFAYGFSPVSITAENGVTAGLDIIFVRKGVRGGNAGVFVGLKF